MLLVLVAAVPALVALLFLQHELRIEREAELRRELVHEADLVDRLLLGALDSARLFVAGMAAHLGSADLAGCAADFAQLVGRGHRFAMLGLVAGDGAPICGAGPAWPPSAKLAPQLRLLTDTTPRIGRYLPGGSSASLPILQRLAIPSSSATGAPILVGAIDLNWLATRLAGVADTPDGTLLIADADGTTLISAPDDRRGQPFRTENRQTLLQASQRGTARITGGNGLPRLVAYVPVKQSTHGLYVGVGRELPQAMAEMIHATTIAYALAAGCAALSLFLALAFGQRYVRRPTKALLAAARQWKLGDLAARARLAEAPNTEFGSLGQAFNDMADSLQHQRAELNRLNEQLERRVATRTRALLDSNNRLQVVLAERERMEASLRQAQKLQAVGQLAGGMAHDFNNLLTAILGSVELLRRHLPRDATLHRLTDTAIQAAERGGLLTAQLLAFSRKQRLAPFPTDLNAVLHRMRGMLGHALGTPIEIALHLADDLWPAMVDPNQLETAVLNLALNARDAMPAGGILTITTANASDIALAGLDLAPGEYVMLSVADTGTGIAPDMQGRVFEPFFTTKAPGKGSGLGLSQVHGLARQSGGDVVLESHAGQGTRVTLYLPRAPALAAPLQPPSISTELPMPTQTVLVVDDDAEVRAVMAQSLAELGVKVRSAANAEEALLLLEAEYPRIGIMVADFAMPGMNGLELIRRAEHRWPGLRSLLATGIGDFSPDDATLAESRIIRKPYHAQELLRQIIEFTRQAATEDA